MSASTPPTGETYQELQQAYDTLNNALFEGQLPPCLITLQRVKRIHGYFEAAKFVRHQGRGKCDEIALNPAYFGLHPARDVLQTLVHEMVHQWQHHCGTPPREANYHNTEWANKMEQIGLMPAKGGEPGEKRTGRGVEEYPIEGGPFEQVAQALMDEGFAVPWCDRQPMPFVPPEEVLAAIEAAEGGHGQDEMAGGGNEADGLNRDREYGQGVADATPLPPDMETEPVEAAKKRASKTKYSCPNCKFNVWGKVGLTITCGACGNDYISAAASADEIAA